MSESGYKEIDLDNPSGQASAVDDIEIVIEHHVAQPRIAPDHAIGLVGGARGV